MRQLAPSLVLLLVGCGSAPSSPGTSAAVPAPAVIAIDGSSTVFPITEAVAEEFGKRSPGSRVTVGVSGTGGGMKKLCAGELAIAGASRPIKPSEVEACAAHGVGFIELPIAYDGIAIVVHPEASWIESITVGELATMWSPESQATVTRWSQVRPEWPGQALHLYGPGVDSGTYDYFTHAIVGKEHSSRGDFTSSEDDNVLVQGVTTDPGGLAFFGLAYYEENRARLKLIPVDDGVEANGVGPVAPSATTVADGSYQPLSRPIFLYVAVAATHRPEVQSFVEYYLGEGQRLVPEVGYVALPGPVRDLVRARFDARTEGTLFGGHGSATAVSLLSLLTAK